MEGLIFKKQIVFLFVLALLATGFFVFVFAQNDNNNPPSALNYAPNFQFDIDEKYYPADPLDFYFENREEIEGAEARAKYDNLSFAEKINNFVVFYHIEDEGNHWVYQYWTFYVLNNSLGKVKNEHYGDWEAVFVFIDKNSKEVIKTIGTAHQRKIFDIEIVNPKTNHIWTYVGSGSHANCVDEKDDGYCDFKKWSFFEKWDKGGIKVEYGDYNLVEITSDFINNFNKAITLKKSSKLGIKINSLKPLGINYIPLGGNPPNYPWAQPMYSNPEEARPYSVKYAGEKIQEAGSGIASFFGGLADKVSDIFKKSAPLQPAGIGGALVDNSVFEIEDDLIVPVEENIVIIQEKPAVIVIKEIKEEPVEVIDVFKEEPIVVEKEIEEIEEDELISQSDIPYGFSPPIGGGAPPDPEPEPEPESEPSSVLAPTITSHSTGDIFGPDNDFSTSTAGFQIDLIGTSTPDYIINISYASTSATTTADNNGDWNCVIDLSEGENNLAIKAIDVDNNESEETSLSLIVDTTSPSDISDLSAVSGNTRGTINLSWTAPGDDGSVGTSTQYIIRYATSSAITADNWALSTEITNELIPSIASATESLAVSELETSETYYWAIKSEDDAGNTSGISNCASTSPSAIAENIVISEIAVQRDSGATDEFIELYNPTGVPINLFGWSIKYASALSTTTWQYKYFDVDGKADKFLPDFSLASYSYYLLTSATSSDPSSNYYSYKIEPDLTAVTSAGVPYYLGLSGDGGKIKLLDKDEKIVDLIAWGENSLGAEGEPVDINGLTWGSLERQAFASSTAELLAVNNAHHWKGNNQDSNNNSQDFVLQTTPNPQNSLSLIEPGTTFPVLADTAWPMLQHDAQHTGLSPYAGTATGTPTSTPKLGWPVNLGTNIPSSPVIGSDSSIYIGASSGKLYKVNVNATGTVELFYSAPTAGTIQTPAISSDGTIYISDNYHYLYALSADGQLKWKYLILDGSSPVIGADGTIYVGSNSYLYAINPNGELIWQSPQLSNGRWVKAPVLASDGTIYTVGKFGTDNGNRNVYALNSQDGSIVWKSASSTFSTAPTLSNDGTILVGGISGLYAINPSDGSQKFLSGIGDVSGSAPAIGSNGIIYIGSYDYCLHAVDLNGVNQWSYGTAITGGKISASPIIDAEGTIYIGSQSGMFYAFNADGGVEWQAELSGAINSSAVIGADGTIYVASSNGILYAFGE